MTFGFHEEINVSYDLLSEYELHQMNIVKRSCCSLSLLFEKGSDD